MIGKTFWLGCLLAWFAFTGCKMVRMAMIRGWLPGVQYEVKQITDLRIVHSTSRKSREMNRHVYYVAWDDGDIGKPGNHRLNVPKEEWVQLFVGREIELTFIDKKPYYKSGIYASTGNFIFDACLLLVSTAGIVYMARVIIATPPARKITRRVGHEPLRIRFGPSRSKSRVRK